MMLVPYFVLFMLLGSKAFGQDVILKPAMENRTTIAGYLLSNAIDTSDVYFVRDSMLLPLISKQFGMLSILIYNRDGNMIRYTGSSFSCVNPAFYLRDMCNLKGYPIDRVNNLNDLHSYMLPYGNVVNKQYDFTVVLLFTKTFAIKLGSDNITEWYKSIDRRCNVRVIKLSMDIQDSWSKYSRTLGLKFYEKLAQRHD